MAKKKACTDVACHHCGAKNPADYTFCFNCNCTPKKGGGGGVKKKAKKPAAKKKKAAKR